MKGLTEPHFLLAGNPYTLINNLKEILNEQEISKIQNAILNESKLIFELAENHFNFASGINPTEWRQRVSRFYYAAYNSKRAVSLCANGKFATDVSDHKDINILPDNLKNKATHAAILKQLRDDRNLADYSHLGTVDHLLIDMADIEGIVGNFLQDCKTYLKDSGVTL